MSADKNQEPTTDHKTQVATLPLARQEEAVGSARKEQDVTPPAVEKDEDEAEEKRWRLALNEDAFKSVKEDYKRGYRSWFECAKRYVTDRGENDGAIEPDESESEIVWFQLFGLSESHAKQCYELYKPTLLWEPLHCTILRFFRAYVAEKPE